MSLFKTEKESDSPTGPLITTQTVPAGSTVMGRKIPFLNSIDQLTKGGAIHFVTEGKWSSHELLSKLLEITGPASVRISTYSMTEDPTRMLVNYLSTGFITDLKVVSDKRFKSNQGPAHQLASANFPIVLTDVHAKVIVLRNDHWNVTVVGSANFTRNKRKESGVIIEDEKIAEFHFKWIDDVE